jgi:regulator of replication initiation timing
VAVRKWYINQALESYSSLRTVLDELTEEEVLAALKLESATLRRRSMISRLISRAIRLNEIYYANLLKEKYHG